MLKVKNWHYLNYEGRFYLCVQRKTNAFLDVYGRFWKFQEVSQSCNVFSNAVVSPSCLQTCFDYN